MIDKYIIADPIIEERFKAEWAQVNDRVVIYESSLVPVMETGGIRNIFIYIALLLPILNKKESGEDLAYASVLRKVTYLPGTYELKKGLEVKNAIAWFELFLRHTIQRGYYGKGKDKERCDLDLSRLKEFKFINIGHEIHDERGLIANIKNERKLEILATK